MNTPIFFYGGIYSQWYASPMVIDGAKYNCAEQYMMAQKAILFDDREIYHAIMRTNNPAEQKALGRSVRKFNIDKWNVIAKEVVYRANLAKFTQHPNLQAELLATGDAELVEASPTDCVWGIGLSENDSRIHDRNEWRGTNWLGEAIMRVRDTLRNG
jgi:ribA/ribD-fused uncharacterized protein